MPDKSLIDLTIEPSTHDLGGFEVRRVLPFAQRRMVGPFVFFDHMGPAEFPAGTGIDVRPHPHIGLATVTYLFEGEILHRDSLGYVQAIQPGAVNWMTAGRGIVHSERTAPEVRAQVHRLHGIQTWLALPKLFEEVEPAFYHHPADTLPRIGLGGAELCLIAGAAYGETSPVNTFSDMFYLEARLPAGQALNLPKEYPERAVYVVDGALEIGDEGYDPGRMVVFTPGVEVRVEAQEDARFMLLGGAEMDGPRHMWWNLVSSSQARIEQAKADWKAERFAQVPGETERIPLPED